MLAAPSLASDDLLIAFGILLAFGTHRGLRHGFAAVALISKPAMVERAPCAVARGTISRVHMTMRTIAILIEQRMGVPSL